MTSEIKPEDVKLPEPEAYIWSPLMSRKKFLDFDLPDVECHYEPLFTADQVRAAVLEAKAQERERCAKLCEEHAHDAWDHEGGALWCAAAIRSGHSITETQQAEE